MWSFIIKAVAYAIQIVIAVYSNMPTIVRALNQTLGEEDAFAQLVADIYAKVELFIDFIAEVFLGEDPTTAGGQATSRPAAA